MPTNQSATTADKTPFARECDREPVHVPGFIQGHGLLLALDHRDLQVQQAGGDMQRLLGIDAQTALGAPVFSLFAGQCHEDLRRLLEGASHTPTASVTLIPAHDEQPKLAATVHNADGLLLLELEPIDPASAVNIPTLLHHCSEMQERLYRSQSIEELWQHMVEFVRRLTGVERVMLYKFHSDYSGEVVAETLAPRLKPFLGHRYPASDIPEPARKLYAQNWLRSIPDVQHEQLPLVPEQRQDTDTPLDLTHARLRGVSPMHIQYLKNMGVQASLSLSVLVHGELWGLVACHNYSGPVFLDFELLQGVKMIARCFSLTLSAMLRHDAYADRLAKDEQVKALQRRIKGTESLEQLLTGLASEVMGLVDAQGLALVEGASVTASGLTPPASAVQAIASWLRHNQQRTVFSSAHLAGHLPQAAEWTDSAAGLLSLWLGGPRNLYLLWFRPEAVVTEQWGGDPEKPFTMNPKDGAIHPRASFVTYKRQVQGQSKSWSEHDTYAAQRLLPLLNEHQIRVAEAQVRQSEERYRAVFEAMSQGVVFQNRQGAITWANLAAPRILGLTMDQIYNRSSLDPEWHAVYENGAPMPGEEHPAMRTLASGTPVENEVMGVFHPQQQSYVWINVSSVPLWLAESQRPSHVCTIFEDLTMRMEARKLREDVDRMTRHDLKAPLTGIINIPELLLAEENLNDEQRDYLRHIQEAGLRMLDMINSSLDLYKMETGAYEFAPRRMDMTRILRRLVKDLRPLTKGHKVFLDVRVLGRPLDAAQALYARGEELLAYSILSNLVVNAVEATPRGGVVTLQLQDGDEVTAEIHNQGVVPEPMRQRFFAKYATFGKSKGTGLGTYIANLMVKTMGGGIEMQTSEAAGTLVRVRLPRE